MTRGRLMPLAVMASALVLAGCTSSAGSGPPSSAVDPAGLATTEPVPSQTPSSTPVSSSSSTVAPSSEASSSSSSPSSSSSSPAPSSSAPTRAPFVTTCTKLTTRVIPGGAIRGAEIAAVQYTNDGSSQCTISGYPRLGLLRNGKKIGTPAQPSGKAVKTLTLQPEEVGESLVRDFSTCNAPLADNARVTVPGRTDADSTTVVRPVKLRACILRIDPVGPPA